MLLSNPRIEAQPNEKLRWSTRARMLAIALAALPDLLAEPGISGRFFETSGGLFRVVPAGLR
jgi:hypothetical protein